MAFFGNTLCKIEYLSQLFLLLFSPTTQILTSEKSAILERCSYLSQSFLSFFQIVAMNVSVKKWREMFKKMLILVFLGRIHLPLYKTLTEP